MNSTQQQLHWGIIGLGNIAHAFVQDLLLVDGVALAAVASRSLNKAEAFAEKYAAPKAYGACDELLADPDIDIVYIATPHDSHHDLTIKALQAGKHVLCEKPVTVNRKQLLKVISVAEGLDLFFMEAFWSRFNPSIREAIAKAKNQELGTINYINADFSFYRDDPDDSRMLNMDLAGGSLLDMGVYPVFLSYMVLGIPKEIHAIGTFHPTGADLQTAAIFKYDGAVANMMSGFQSQSDMRARICGTKGSIFLEPIWHETQSYFQLDNQSGEITHFPHPTRGKGFTYEIEECIRCIQAGQEQSELWSWQHSLDMLEITDEIRRQIGLIYPFEK